MSEYENSREDIPRFEPWIAVSASSLIPVIVALYVHSRYLAPLIVASVAVFLTSLVMLRRQRVRDVIDREPTSTEVRSIADRFGREELETGGVEP